VSVRGSSTSTVRCSVGFGVAVKEADAIQRAEAVPGSLGHDDHRACAHRKGRRTVRRDDVKRRGAVDDLHQLVAAAGALTAVAAPCGAILASPCERFLSRIDSVSGRSCGGGRCGAAPLRVIYAIRCTNDRSSTSSTPDCAADRAISVCS
jgi:hypothetical protein